jgi:hypothetical protein
MQSALDTSRMSDSAIVFCPTTAGLGARRFDQFNGGAIEPREKSAKATARKSNNANAKTPSCSALCIPPSAAVAQAAQRIGRREPLRFAD